MSALNLIAIGADAVALTLIAVSMYVRRGLRRQRRQVAEQVAAEARMLRLAQDQLRQMGLQTLGAATMDTAILGGKVVTSREEELAAIKLSLADKDFIQRVAPRGYTYSNADVAGMRRAMRKPEAFTSMYDALSERVARVWLRDHIQRELMPLVLERYRNMGLAWRLHQDGDDKLWSIHICQGWRRILLLEVYNSTTKEDGSRQVYFIPVDTQLRPMRPGKPIRPMGSEWAFPTFGEPQEYTVRNAIASTFGLRGEEYDVGAAA